MQTLSKYLRLFSFITLFFLFVLQGIWLHQTFQLTKSNLEKQIEQEFIYAIQQDADIKEKNRQTDKNNKEFIFDAENIDISSFPVNIMILEALHFHSTPIETQKIATILKKNLEKKNLSTNFSILHINTVNNNIIENSKPIKPLNVRPTTIRIPIRADKSEELVLHIFNSNMNIFKHLLAVILISIAIVFIIIAGIWWQFKCYQKEKILREFQKDHTATVSHNMATPLHTIKTINEMLLIAHTLTSEKQNTFLKKQKKQIEKLQNQVEQILLLSGSNTSEIILDLKKINIKLLLMEVCKNFKHFPKKKLQINTFFESTEHKVFIDPQLFTDVLNNLIENAIKYSNKNVIIDIKCKLSENNLTLTISDNGLGIPQKYQKNIFDKFNRGASPFRNGEKGFGLGLSFVKEVVEAHKGSITLFSEGENRGTSFEIKIPQ